MRSQRAAAYSANFNTLPPPEHEKGYSRELFLWGLLGSFGAPVRQ